MTLEEMQRLPEEKQEELYKKLKIIRHKAKTTNYSSTYNAGPAKIARGANMPLEEGKVLHSTFWNRNWSIRKIAEDTVVKTLRDGEMWLWNPVAKLWYSLRYEKDKFSTLNQGTGSYAFDTYLGYVLKHYKTLVGQFHDEFIFEISESEKERFEDIVHQAIRKTNKHLKLNRELDIGLDFGKHYGEIH